MTSNGDHDEPEQFTDVTFEELIDLETEQDAVDVQILRQHWQLSQPLFKRRRDIIARIPHFWSLVFDEAPPEIENHIQPSDARLFAEHLVAFDVERFEIESEPRSVELVFEFGKGNPYFGDEVLRKRFWWRKSVDGWSGLVSEPVPIRWKAGKDLTKGLTGAALELWNAWKQAGGEETRKGFAIVKDHEAYTALKYKLEESDFSVHSFFTLFTFVSANRYVSAAESADASEKEAKQWSNKTSGVKEEQAGDAEEEVDDVEVMACPQGDDIANVLVEELYTNAIKYFTSAHERDSEAQSEEDFEEDDEMDEGAESDAELQNEPPRKKHKQTKYSGR